MRDASLDDFLTTDEGDEEPDGEAEGDGTEAEPDSEDAEPGAGLEPDPKGGPDPEPDAEPPVESGERAGEGDDPEAEPDGPPSVAEVEPARTTFAWSADGAACAACGERVEERWEADTGLVCTECKKW